MKLVPRVLLISIAALGLSGCRAYGPTPSPKLLPPPEPQALFDVQEFVSEHNRNAELVESLKAKSQITASKVGRLKGAPMAGVMVMERPRNFKLELRADTALRKSIVADIGSNDAEFWFMLSEEKTIYTCKFDELPSTPMAVSFQPDWIIDALGLKVISPKVAREIKAKPGPDPQTTDLVFPTVRSNGQTTMRIVTVSNQDRRIKTHRLLSGDGKTLLAQADISSYQETPLDDSGESGEKAEVFVVLPQKIKLDWKQEQFTLVVNLKDVELNNFDPEKRSAVFVEPSPPGYAHVNLANSRKMGESSGETTIRESLPSPDSKSSRGVRLEKIVPDEDDAAAAPPPDTPTTRVTASRYQNHSPSRSGRLGESAPIEQPLRARPPQAPNSYDFQLADSFRENAPAAISIER